MRRVFEKLAGMGDRGGAVDEVFSLRRLPGWAVLRDEVREDCGGDESSSGFVGAVAEGYSDDLDALVRRIDGVGF